MKIVGERINNVENIIFLNTSGGKKYIFQIASEYADLLQARKF